MGRGITWPTLTGTGGEGIRTSRICVGMRKTNISTWAGRWCSTTLPKSPTLEVPGAWNTENPKLDYYEGLLWYERQVTVHPAAGKRYFLHFGAVNYQADVFVNDHWVCEHKGGFTSFSCEVTGALKDGANSVVVAVDDTRKVDRVPTLEV